MKLEQTVCSLDLAQQLKELKVPQKSLFYWNCYKPGEKGLPLAGPGLNILQDESHTVENYSAFTVAELGEMLCAGVCIDARTKKPKYGEIFQSDKCPKWEPGDKMWALYLAGNEIYTFDDNEANARARFLVSLLERKIVKAREVKA